MDHGDFSMILFKIFHFSFLILDKICVSIALKIMLFTKARYSLRPVVVQCLNCWAFDQKVVSSNPSTAKLLLLDPLSSILNVISHCSG